MASNVKYRTAKLKNKPVKTLIVKTMMFCLGRGFQSIAKRDVEVIEEVKAWPEGFVIVFEVLPKGPYLTLKKANGRLRYMGMKKNQADLTICFKNIDSALSIFLPIIKSKMGTAKAYAEHRLSVKGDLVEAMRLIRCLNIVEHYLFPAFISKNILKRHPYRPFGKLMAVRVAAYVLGICLGL